MDSREFLLLSVVAVGIVVVTHQSSLAPVADLPTVPALPYFTKNASGDKHGPVQIAVGAT